jgi:hypothetical protein
LSIEINAKEKDLKKGMGHGNYQNIGTEQERKK